MGQQRLTDLSFLSIEAENLEKLKSTLAMDDLINMFAEKKGKKSVNLNSIRAFLFLSEKLKNFTLNLSQPANFDTGAI